MKVPGTTCSSWVSMGAASGNAGVVHAVHCLPNGDIVAGGLFLQSGSTALNHIGRWDGSAWSPLGSGMNQQVLALCRLPNGDVIAGGPFTIAGGVPANYIARWNGTAWSPIGSGMNDRVRAIQALPSGELAVSGAELDKRLQIAFHTATPEAAKKLQDNFLHLREKLERNDYSIMGLTAGVGKPADKQNLPTSGASSISIST